eukprot:5052826-Prymnesium_polylepis.1
MSAIKQSHNQAITQSSNHTTKPLPSPRRGRCRPSAAAPTAPWSRPTAGRRSSGRRRAPTASEAAARARRAGRGRGWT